MRPVCSVLLFRHFVPRLRTLYVVAAGVLIITLTSRWSDAALVMVNTPGSSTTGGLSVNARATVTTSANQVTIFLENLQVDPRSVTQAISGFQFHLSSGETVGSLTSSSGVERTIADNGAFTNGASAASGWSLSKTGSDLKLNLLGMPTAPDHTIIGPPGAGNLYANANASIKNGIHSPFFGQSATFTMDIPGVTTATTVTSGVFQFNTSGGNTVPGTTVPEPATGATMFMIATTMLGSRRRRA